MFDGSVLLNLSTLELLMPSKGSRMIYGLLRYVVENAFVKPSTALVAWTFPTRSS